MRNTYLRDKEKGLWDEDAQAVNAAVIREIGDYELAVKMQVSVNIQMCLQ